MWTTAVAVVAVVAIGILAIQPGIAGLFHDDGIYLSVAESLMEGDGYRLANLPGTPPQTKYPFLFAGLLAIIGRLAPPFPGSIPAMKALGVACLGAVAILAALWYRRRVGPDAGRALFVILVCVNPLVLPTVDYTMTELPFLATCLAALWIAEPPSMPSGARWAPGRREAIALGIVVGAALLLRQAALPLVLGGAIVLWSARRRDLVAIFGVIVFVCLAPWLTYKWLVASEAANPLISYYVSYEPSVPELLVRDGLSALGIVRDNIVYVAGALDTSLYLPVVPSLRLLVYPVVALGWARCLWRPWGLIHWFAGLYSLLIILWPWHPGRYSLPLVPLMPLGLVVGTRHLWQFADRLFDQPRARLAARIFASLPSATIVLLAFGWSTTFIRTGRGDTVRLWFAEDSGYSWSGFQETFDWIRENTDPDAVLASGLDPVYYLYTGRSTVRPWFHRPWTYFYPAGRATPDVGAPDDVRAALEALEVRYLISDPLVGYVEGAVNDLFGRLLDSYARETGSTPVLRFVSSDSLHHVYELPVRPDEGSGRRP